MINFSKHDYVKEQDSVASVYTLKLPNDKYTYRVNFINCLGVCTVTGDFGNWVFNREYYPDAKHIGMGGIEYMIEKLGQFCNPYYYDDDLIIGYFERMIKEYREELKTCDEEEKDGLQNKIKFLQGIPNHGRFLDIEKYLYDSVYNFTEDSWKPVHPYLYTIEEAFREMCRREKINDN